MSAAYTSGEVLLNTLLLMIEWEKRSARAVTRTWFEDEGLVKRLRSHYHESLGDNWNPTSGPIGKWMVLAGLRGRVVHAGYLPTEDEAEMALETMGVLSDFVKERLAAKVKIYPRTALQLLGEPGLRRLGGWSKWIEGFVAADTTVPTGTVADAQVHTCPLAQSHRPRDPALHFVPLARRYQ